MNRRQILGGIGTTIGGMAGCVGGLGGGELVTETLEGDGDSLLELEIVNDGAVFFETESDTRFSVEAVPEGEGRSSGFWHEAFLGRSKNHLDIDAGEYAVDVRSDGEWMFDVRQYPTGVDTESPDYPLIIEGDTIDAFGPFSFDTFVNIETRSENLFGLGFVELSGERARLMSHDPMGLSGDEIDHGTEDLEGEYWIVTTMNLNWTDEDSETDFEIEFNAPD